MPDFALPIAKPSVIPEARGPAPGLCTQCGEPAVYAYLWPWGEAGLCCALHAAALQQTARNLDRTIGISPLQAAAPPPLEHTERVRMTAEVMTYRQEAEDTRKRNLELYNANVELRREITRQAGEVAELKSQVDDLREEVQQLGKEKMLALKDLATRTNELVRLEGILHAAETAPG